MIDELEMERLYARFRLVRGKGDRSSGGLCIMTFVALLAGERHTDMPSTASRLVQQFAIVLNDAMPDTERERLKPFAPRIIGTADGFDVGRAAVLRQTIQQEVFPQICADLVANTLPSVALYDPCGAAAAQPAKELLCGFAVLAVAEDTPRHQRQLALRAARLLTACAAGASNAAAREWYWAKAIDLLDRLCEVGPRPTRPGLEPIRIEKLLSQKSLASGRVRRAADTLRWLGQALIMGIDSITESATKPAETVVPDIPTACRPSSAEAASEQIVVPGA